MNECISREEFIATLKRELHNIEPTELDEVLRYYNEYLDEAHELGDDNLQKVLVELGSPKKIAHEIRQNMAVKDLLNEEKKGGDFKNIALIILGVFSLPITFPLAISFVAILFSILVCLLSLLFALFVTGGAFMFAGVVAFFAIFGAMISEPLAGFMFLGFALASTGFGVIMIILTLILTQNSFKVFGSTVNKFINTKKEG